MIYKNNGFAVIIFMKYYNCNIPYSSLQTIFDYLKNKTLKSVPI
jgi:predicted transcriptional regulator